jgi:hypothetical protein
LIDKKQPFICGVGMELHKKEQVHKNGETLRLCIWDPTLTMLPKERLTKRKNREAAKAKKK